MASRQSCLLCSGFEMSVCLWVFCLHPKTMATNDIYLCSWQSALLSENGVSVHLYTSVLMVLLETVSSRHCFWKEMLLLTSKKFYSHGLKTVLFFLPIGNTPLWQPLNAFLSVYTVFSQRLVATNTFNFSYENIFCIICVLLYLKIQCLFKHQP